MTAEAARSLLHAYVDGELDAASSVELEAELGSSPALQQELARLSALRNAVRARATRFDAPPELGRALFARLPAPQDIAARPGVPMWWRHLALGATAAALALLLWITVGFFALHDTRSPLLDEVVSLHIRSLMAEHLTDLTSADRHSIRPWLSNRLDYAPPVHDLAIHGVRLVGARLDYVGGKVAAAIVYRLRQHVINVVVWPASSRGTSSIHLLTHRGFHAATFESGGMTYWAVSDLNSPELGKFAALLQRAAPAQ